MNRYVCVWATTTLLAGMVSCCAPIFAQDTVFSYQGELKQNGSTADGLFNMEFALWDSIAAGNQIGSTEIKNGVEVVNGKFTVELDFGSEAFDNSGRWLEIVVGSFTLSPRNAITRSPYSVQTRGVFVDDTERVGMGTTNPAARLDVVSDTFNSGNNTARFSAPIIGPNTSHIHYGFSGDWFIRSAQSLGNVSIQDTGGTVGIGTANPSDDAKLTLTASASEKALFALSADTFLPTIHAFNVSGGESIWAEGNGAFFAALLAENNGTGPAISAVGGSDSEPESGGILVVGSNTGANISIDNNEIMARNNGSTSTLFLNADGGDIKMGTQQTHPPHAYGRIASDGSLLSGSPNIVSTEHPHLGWYEIELDGGIQFTDIILVTVNEDFMVASGNHENGLIRVRIAYALTGNVFNSEFSFVVYRP